MTEELNFVLQARREKLEALEAAGIVPYAYGFDPTHSAAAALSLLGTADEGPAVTLAALSNTHWGGDRAGRSG